MSSRQPLLPLKVLEDATVRSNAERTNHSLWRSRKLFREERRSRNWKNFPLYRWWGCVTLPSYWRREHRTRNFNWRVDANKAFRVCVYEYLFITVGSSVKLSCKQWMCLFCLSIGMKESSPCTALTFSPPRRALPRRPRGWRLEVVTIMLGSGG